MRFLPLLLLAACAPSQEQFEDQSWQASCDLMFECITDEEREAMGDFWFFGATVDDCYALIENAEDDTASSEPKCDYDKNAAKECLAGLEALTCDEFNDGSYETPPACADVCGGGDE